MSKVHQGRTIGAKVWTLSLSLIINLFLLGAISFWNSRILVHSLSDADTVDIPAVREMALLDMAHDAIRASVMASIVASSSKDPNLQSFRADSEEHHKAIRAHLESLKQLSLNGETKQKLDALAPEIEPYIASAQEIVDLSLSGNAEKALEKLPTFNQKFEELEKKLAQAGDELSKDIAASQIEDHAFIDRANIISAGALALSILIGLINAWYVIRGLKNTLKEITAHLNVESETVSAAANQLHAASESLSEATNQQASALQETAASVDEITAMVKKTSENAKHLEMTADASQKSANDGQESIRQMLLAIETISESHSKIMNQVEDGNQKITEIVKVIGEIGNKTKVINDIVFQTKLLSFNASVEAARAGEHGKGFAVVAEEVGNLAQMSGNAAKEISDMLGASISKVEGIVTENKRKVEGLIVDGKEKIELGGEVAKQCGASLDQIVRNSSEVGSRISEITTAIQEQNQGIHEISKAVQLLDQSTHENSTTSKETANTSQNLLEQAQSLSGIVLQINTLVNGKKPRKHNSEENNSPNVQEPEMRKQSEKKAKVISLEQRKPKTQREIPAPSVGLTQKKVVGGAFFPPSEDDPRFEDI